MSRKNKVLPMKSTRQLIQEAVAGSRYSTERPLRLGEDFHKCTPETCPEPGNYYVTCVENDPSNFYVMSGPYRSHQAALNDAPRCLEIAYKHDARAWFKAWGTARLPEGFTKPGKLQEAGLLEIPQ